jgi:hypothetical protein
MHPLLFAALTGLWELCGGHVTFGAVLGMFVARVVYENSRSVRSAIIAYFVTCFLFWIVADWIWGPYRLASTTEFPHY